jgi:hypothetical protein
MGGRKGEKQNAIHLEYRLLTFACLLYFYIFETRRLLDTGHRPNSTCSKLRYTRDGTGIRPTISDQTLWLLTHTTKSSMNNTTSNGRNVKQKR